MLVPAGVEKVDESYDDFVIEVWQEKSKDVIRASTSITGVH